MRPLALATLLTLLLAPAAHAKEVTAVTVCGADGCVTSRNGPLREGIMNADLSAATAAAAPVIRVRAAVSAPGEGVVGRFTTWWAPSSRQLIAEDGIAMRLPAAAEAVLARLAGGMETLPWSATGLAGPARAEPPASPPASGGFAWPWLLLALPVAAAAWLAVRRAQARSATAGSAASPVTKSAGAS